MEKKLCVFNQTRESFLSLGVSLAGTSVERLKGLMGRWKLKSDDGLWVVPSRGIHTIGVFFPIDLVYLDSKNRVIDLIENLGPFRITPIRRQSASVLELQTRTIYSSHTRLGDQMLICSPERMESLLLEMQSEPAQVMR